MQTESLPAAFERRPSLPEAGRFFAPTRPSAIADLKKEVSTFLLGEVIAGGGVDPWCSTRAISDCLAMSRLTARNEERPLGRGSGGRGNPPDPRQSKHVRPGPAQQRSVAKLSGDPHANGPVSQPVLACAARWLGDLSCRDTKSHPYTSATMQKWRIPVCRADG